MQSIFTTTLPFFALIFIGYVAARLKLLDDASIAGVNAFVFYFALPAFLFDIMANSSPADVLNGPFIAAYLVVGLVLFALTALVSRLAFGLKPGEAALQGLGAVLANTGYMGLPLIATLLGEEATLPIAVGLTLDVMVLMPLGIAIVEAGQGKGGGWRRILGSTSASLVRNPLMVAIFSGALISATGLGLPSPVTEFANLLGGAAGPCALFALGATLAGRAVSGSLGEISLITTAKLLIHPAAIWAVTTQLFDVDSLWATAATLGAALPVAANVFIVARQYNVYVDRTSTAILVSTVLSLFTVSALIVALGVA